MALESIAISTELKKFLDSIKGSDSYNKFLCKHFGVAKADAKGEDEHDKRTSGESIGGGIPDAGSEEGNSASEEWQDAEDSQGS